MNELPDSQGLILLEQVLEIYDQKQIALHLNTISPEKWNREAINRWRNGKAQEKLTHDEFEHLKTLLPKRPAHYEQPEFDFIDLFAGIGGIRNAFESIGGRCVFTSEWNKFSVKTYKANWYSEPGKHVFNQDIRSVTLSEDESISEKEAYKHIDQQIPDHDVLLAGFPCQPFSLAGVSKKNSLGRSHGFECETQGTLFFDVARIIAAKRPKSFILENVKNLKSHDKGKTFKIIQETLIELGYDVADVDASGPRDPKIIDGKHFTPQHRERIVLVGFRKDLDVAKGFTLKDIVFPESKPTFNDLLDKSVDAKYTLTPKLWEYLYNYAKKHKAKGNGFGFGLVDPKNENAVARTLSARYHKDGSEILIDHKGWDMSLAETDFQNEANQINRPRRLTPRECSRLMGFDKPNESKFRIPVSDTQAYRQFGNSVVAPVFEAVANLMKPSIIEAIKKSKNRK
ncbi:DNA (cytosine-5-)-methyltransferase [Moritella dasanensis]|uniref:DNA (cytosine-5-)-methyltransferase n=1 Tax=Moritella dasanensis TaxID=428031 RepID=UPI0002FB5E98|nr:DNA (cytosine-5-)-methyltransferase [Moritella dasanensis]